jgi:predicted nucleotidyltransferase
MDSVEQIKQILIPIFTKEPIQRAVLFGSYARGTHSNLSDVDIVIDSNGHLIGLDFFRVLDEIVQALRTDVDLFEAAEIVAGSPMETTILNEGITLYERKVA